MTRPKPFLTYFILCAIPLLLLAGLDYWHGVRTVESNISSIAQGDLNSVNVTVDEILRDKERSILRLALSPNVQRVLRNETSPDLSPLPGDLDPHFQTLSLFGADRQPLWFRAKENNMEWKSWIAPANRPADISQPDPRVWVTQGNVCIERAGSTPATFEFSTPIHAGDKGAPNLGAMVGALDLDAVFASAARGLESSSGSMVVVLDRAGQVVYHSDRSLKLRPASEALPGFESLADAMKNNESGQGEFRSASGASYLAAYSPIPRLNVAVAVARTPSHFISDAHRWGIGNLLLAVLAALAAAFILERHVQRRSRGMARVTEDLSAIAKGELDRRIVLQSSDDARAIADNINVVTERLRAQIAREEESRQFESFVRLSAMLTHDLKNAIEGLSLTVGNMEKHFDNPQFRSDALKGLTSAADKLKAIVARLARPVMSLSGEQKRPTNVDLVPIIQRVVSITAEPQRGKHKIVTRLPPTLFALVDAARIEEVIENLVLNALEAMETGGTLTIEAGETGGGAPMFSVGDTGRGMSRSFIEHRLFRPFSTTKKTGIGLGLYTCREVIKASAGTIEVDSVEGAGTTFRVVLPSTSHDRRN
ncbi:MAG TPA: ATP-binding protein [Pyrinomonadaceae bacterium]|nr:ATP-binding protein [Pyrinomonadaceae bacterium]